MAAGPWDGEAAVAAAGFEGRAMTGGTCTWTRHLARGLVATLSIGPRRVDVTIGAPGREPDLVASSSASGGPSELDAFGAPARRALVTVLAAFACSQADGYMGR